MILTLYSNLDSRWKNLAMFAAAITLAAVAGISAYLLNYTNDWIRVFRPAALAFLRGELRPAEYGLFNFPWTCLFTAPLALLPARIGSACVAGLTVLAGLFAARRMRANLFAVALIAAMPHTTMMIMTGNVDWLVLLGAALPPAWGLPLVLVKPQIGLAIAVYWFVVAWQQGRWQALGRLLLPLAGCMLITWLVGGQDAYNMTVGDIAAVPWNQSFFPWSFPIGLLLLGWAIVSQQARLALLAGPLLAPYVGFYSWPVALMGTAKKPHDTLALIMFLMFTYQTMHIYAL